MAKKTTQTAKLPTRTSARHALRTVGIILPDGSVEMGRASKTFHQNLRERFLPALAGAR